ncbi:hypothetical protein FNF29_05820 [Cafeteria roenbergensis]|uniref:Uncharacterized protein n=1 Tax=Cafeteria roenbergensis TaxID=33653 RepID=A0A5A8C9X9_CAFRO|nr:hypothetical protein FNF29_05820 [Cafeteria roenbergensis]|eukprot:KAA0149608.1 hypothetical protein FNF29_05820 [Cafeteria roenbergensis]
MASFFSMLGSAVQSLGAFDTGKPKPPSFASLAQELIDLHEEAVDEGSQHGARVVLQKGDPIVAQVSKLSRSLTDASDALASRSSSLSKAEAQAVFDDVMGSSFVEALCTRSLANVPEGMLPLVCNFLAHLIEVHPDPASMLAVGKVRRPVLNLIAVFLDTGRGESAITTRSRKSSVRHVMHLVLKLWRCASSSPALASCLLAAADPGAASLPGQMGSLDGVMVRAVMAHARFNGPTGTLARRAALLAARVRIPSVAFWLCRGRQWESAAAETSGPEAATKGPPAAGDPESLEPVGQQAGDKPGLVALVIAALASFADRLPLGEGRDEAAIAACTELSEVVACLEFFQALASDTRQLGVAPPVDSATRVVRLADQVLGAVPASFFGQVLPRFVARAAEGALEPSAAGDKDSIAAEPRSPGPDGLAAPPAPAASPGRSPPAALPSPGADVGSGETPSGGVGRASSTARSGSPLPVAVLVVIESVLLALGRAAEGTASECPLLGEATAALLSARCPAAGGTSGPLVAEVLAAWAESPSPAVAAAALRVVSLMVSQGTPFVRAALCTVAAPPRAAVAACLRAAGGSAVGDAAAAAAEREGLPDPADAVQCPCLSALVLLPEAVKQLVGSESESTYREAAAAAVQAADIEQGLLQVMLEERLPRLPTAEADPATAAAVGAALMRAAFARIGSLMVDSEPCVLAASGLAMGLLRAGPTAVRATLLFGAAGEREGMVLGLQRLNGEIARRATAQARSGFELALIMAQQDAGWGPVAGAEEVLANAGAEDVSEARALLDSRAHKPFVVRAALGFEVLKETAATLVVISAIEAAMGDA